MRRYVDLVNQWQIIACARHGRTAALAAPFKPRDTALFAIISGFDAAYTAYNDFQHGIERYWTLRWIEQNRVQEIEAAVMKDGLVRAESLPLVFRVPGTENLPRGARILARVTGIDLLTLDLHAQLLQRLDQTPVAADEADAEPDDDAETAGPLSLAIDINDAGAEPGAPEGGDTAPAP